MIARLPEGHVRMAVHPYMKANMSVSHPPKSCMLKGQGYEGIPRGLWACCVGYITNLFILYDQKIGGT